MAVEVERGYAKGRAKRREIIDRAVTLFGEVGYRGASLREIAGRCGISHPGLLHHFPTKEALLLAVLEHRDEVDSVWVAGGDDDDPVSGLRRLVEVVERNTGRRPVVELYAVLSAEATSADHPAHEYFQDRYRRALGAVRSAYERARDAGALRDGVEPGTAARHLVALMDGLQVQWLLDDGATDMVAVVRDHVRAQLVRPL